jgi:hypothetical protein
MSSVEESSQVITYRFAREWVRNYCDAWNSHDPAELVKLANPDVLWEDPGIYPDGVSHNRDFLTDWVRHLLHALPDLKVEPLGEPFVALDRSRIMFEWETTGHMTGPLDPPGFAPTGLSCGGRGFDCHSFRDGLLSHVLTVTDIAAFAKQIGAMPPAGSLGERLGVMVQHRAAKKLRRQA